MRGDPHLSSGCAGHAKSAPRSPGSDNTPGHAGSGEASFSGQKWIQKAVNYLAEVRIQEVLCAGHCFVKEMRVIQQGHAWLGAPGVQEEQEAFPRLHLKSMGNSDRTKKASGQSQSSPVPTQHAHFMRTCFRVVQTKVAQRLNPTGPTMRAPRRNGMAKLQSHMLPKSHYDFTKQAYPSLSGTTRAHTRVAANQHLHRPRWRRHLDLLLARRGVYTSGHADL